MSNRCTIKLESGTHIYPKADTYANCGEVTNDNVDVGFRCSEPAKVVSADGTVLSIDQSYPNTMCCGSTPHKIVNIPGGDPLNGPYYCP